MRRRYKLIGQGAGDVTGLPTASAKGQITVYDGSDWQVLSVGTDDQYIVADSAESTGLRWATFPTVPSDISDLGDVDTSGVSDGDTLEFNSGTGNWEPATGGGGASAIGELSDVLTDIATEADDEAVLVWNDSQGLWGPAGGGPVNGQLRKAAVVLDSTNVDSDLTDFPVLITEDMLPSEMLDADGTNSCQTDGGDIRFTSDADGTTILPMDLVYISLDNDPANSVVECWVKVPTVTSASDTTIYVWYKAGTTLSPPADTDASGRNAVWTDYVAVWHLQEDDTVGTDGVVDSTGNGYSMTEIAADSPGVFGDQTTGGYELTPNQYLRSDPNVSEFGLIDSGDPAYTFQMWVWPDTESDRTLIRRFGEYSWHLIDQTASDSNMSVVLEVNNTSDTSSTATDQVPIGQWSLLHMTHDPGTDVRVLVDGVSGDGNQAFTATDTNSNQYLYFGYRENAGTQTGTDFFDGKFDEIRIRTDRLSDAWCKAEYYNQSAPGTFGTAGTPEDVIQFAPFDPAYVTQLSGSATEIVSRGTNASVDSTGVILIGRDAGGQAGTNTTHDDLFIMGHDTGPTDLSIFSTGGSFPDDLSGHMIIGHKNWQHMTSSGRKKFADLVIGYKVGEGLSHGGTAGDDGKNTVIGVKAARLTDESTQSALSSAQAENVIVGYKAAAGRRAVGSKNVIIGCEAGRGGSGDTGYPVGSVIIGYRAAAFSDDGGGSQSVIIGYEAAERMNATSSRWTVLGFGAAASYISGTQNTVIGYGSDTANSDSTYTVCVGNQNDVSGDYSISIGSLNRPPTSMDRSILLGMDVNRSGADTIPTGSQYVFYTGTYRGTGTTSAPLLHGDMEHGNLTLGYVQQASSPYPMLGVFEWGSTDPSTVPTYNTLKLMESTQGPVNKPEYGAFLWVDGNEDDCVKVMSSLPTPASTARDWYLAPISVWDPNQEDGDATIDLTNVAAVTHKTTAATTTTTLTFSEDDEQPLGVRGYIANEDGDTITLAEGTGVTIKDWTAASGGAPTTGSVTVSQGEIYEWYKRGETEYWVWRVNS